MLLCYLRDFVSVRYDKILELSNRYDGILHLEKEIITATQTVTYHIDLHDCRKNDKFLRENNPCRNVIDRIDLILKTVLAFLATPLMECAAKVAMLKPPITKTNVLKMNQNFKACMELYEYLVAYNKPGYSVEDLHKKINPMPEMMSDEFAEATSLLSFLTYEHSMGIHDYLREEYNKEEARRKEEEKLKLAISFIVEDKEKEVRAFKEDGKLLEAQRLNQRTDYDVEMMKEIGFCKGIEN
jgi:hypothetical protein